MTEKNFFKLIKSTIVNYFNENVNKNDNKRITEDDVYVVWSCRTLQNYKALASTKISYGIYYEITHNGDKNETYFDVYERLENFVVKQNIESEE